MGALASGVVTLVSASQSTISLSLTAATGGTAPYTYQWYRSTTSGFTPGGGNIIAGATSLTLNDSGLIPTTQYYYKNIVTDNVAATSTSAQFAAATTNPVQSQNQFAQSSQLGMIDMVYAFNTHPVLIDSSQVGTLLAGCAVKLVPQSVANATPRVIGCAANSDDVFGFLNFDLKNTGWIAGQAAEVSLSGNIMYLYATGAITQGGQVQLDLSTNGGVAAAVGASGANLCGRAYDGAAAAGALIRVYLSVFPNFTKA